MLASALDGTAGDGQAVGQVLVVVAHVIFVVIEVVSDSEQGFSIRSNELAFGDGLAKAFDDLRDVAFENSGASQTSADFGFGAAFLAQYTGGLPNIVQNVKQVEDKSDFEFLTHEDLKRAIAVGDGEPSQERMRIATDDFVLHF